MKRLFFWVLVALLAGITLHLRVSSADVSEGWSRVRDNVFIKEKTITHLSNELHSLWIKVVPAKNSNLLFLSQLELKKLQKGDQEPEYLCYLSEIECGSLRHRKISTIYYRKDKNIIASQHNDNAKWESVIENGMIQDVYNTVCRDQADSYSLLDMR